MAKDSVTDRVLKVLKKHPKGLTTVEISEEIGMGRHSLSKYIYQLLGEGKISQRKIGTAKLCYLKGVKKNVRKRS